MRIATIRVGHAGSSQGAVPARIGRDVPCVDMTRIHALSEGRQPDRQTRKQKGRTENRAASLTVRG